MKERHGKMLAMTAGVALAPSMTLMPRTPRAEPTGELLELAQLARDYAGELSLRQLVIKTGVNRQSLSRLMNGWPVEPATLLAFAVGLRRPVNPLREALGKSPIFPDPAELSAEPAARPSAAETDPQLAAIVRTYEEGNEDDRRLIYELTQRFEKSKDGNEEGKPRRRS
jgi:hypothetical protein